MAGSFPVLDQLKSMGLHLSVVSNADENQLQPLIECAQLDRWLMHWTRSESAKSCKPDPRFFEVALGKSGLAANEVVFDCPPTRTSIHRLEKLGLATPASVSFRI